MGTRGTVHWNEKITYEELGTNEIKTKENNVLNVYNHWDSYPEGLGRSIAEFLNEYKLVNGISGNDTGKIANGFNDLALLWVCEHKNGKVGDVYATTEDCRLEEYNYTITDDYDYRRDPWFCPEPKHLITIKCVDYKGELVYEGTPKEWIEWLDKMEG